MSESHCSLGAVKQRSCGASPLCVQQAVPAPQRVTRWQACLSGVTVHSRSTFHLSFSTMLFPVFGGSGRKAGELSSLEIASWPVASSRRAALSPGAQQGRRVSVQTAVHCVLWRPGVGAAGASRAAAFPVKGPECTAYTLMPFIWEEPTSKALLRGFWQIFLSVFCLS